MSTGDEKVVLILDIYLPQLELVKTLIYVDFVELVKIREFEPGFAKTGIFYQIGIFALLWISFPNQEKKESFKREKTS